MALYPIAALCASSAVLALGFGTVRCCWRSMQRVARLTQRSPFTYYHPGPFLRPMSRREAGQILGVSAFAPAAQIKEAHRRVMLLNHPDRGGSPFLALKINEAKEMLSR